MYLKKIIISGFKSFADKIELEFTNGISGVVGPNGSGKSNVVDAIRWVLGEQSVKSLRGDGAMTDVIFSGSKSRRSMNIASVTLLFDNANHYLNLNADEVSIKRRLYKDGTNEYFINNERCRLKDITDLFLDSGIGRESFNIISQGKVESIINDKPEERRIIFEEAAGVLKYKKRKNEAFKKLERTHNNMNRVKDIMDEIKVQLEPLEIQSQKAKVYKNKTGELNGIDIALITTDITNLNFDYQKKKDTIEEINKEIITLSTQSTTSDVKLEEFKKQLSNLEETINNLQTEYVNQVELVEKLKSKKDMLLESKKYEVEDTKLHSQMLTNEENILLLTNTISSLEEDILKKQKLVNKQVELVKNIETELENTKNERRKQDLDLTKLVREEENLNRRISYLKESIDNNATLPSSVRSVLNNPKLRGIHDVIGNVIEIEKEYTTAIMTSLGYASNYVIVTDSESAKDAINYLKEKRLGKVTFFPMSVIKGKNIDSITKDLLKKQTGVVGVASSLVKYDPKYQSIIENQLGNVIVATNIEEALKISKAINYRYRIITIDGEVLHVGGSLTGGKEASRRNVIEDKYELEVSLKKIEQIKQNLSECENKINEIDYKYQQQEDKRYLLNKEKISLTQELEGLISNKNNLTSNLEIAKDELHRMDLLLNHEVSLEEKNIMEEYYKGLAKKESLNKELEDLKETRSKINLEYGEFEAQTKQENNLLYQKNKQLKDLEIEVNRIDVKLDTLLNKLTENYNLTYERAITLYQLEMDIDAARLKVSNLKKEIKELGDVNLGAIEEFDRLNERYTFLVKQKDDLDKAEATLLEIMKEMDDVLIQEFSKSFKEINIHFKETFKELFKGGDASLKLTDPDNILETGVEIIASPPGKQMKKLSLLSGGEKTFTAISLLFAILKSRPVPFCVLDEVEAALDEVNVKSFGDYVEKLRGKTQFILITHKKKTMEYADVLYGITMQESGVSKLVSVKLEGIDV